RSIAKYRLEQFTPVVVDKENVLLTTHGALDNNRFLDPRSKKTFHCNVAKKEVSDIQAASSEIDQNAEGYRSEIDNGLDKYIKEHYPSGLLTVYGKSSGGSISIIACIEDHKFSPENFWNGRWRSEWKIEIEDGNAKVVGVLKTQVHYYEDGNVQLMSHKDCKDNLTVSSEKQLAEDLAKLIAKCESDYQVAINANYNSMSTTTFKALRRQLPVTRTKIDWNKILGYQIGKEI
uniref:F-actin-capping protein subunit alpha n=1 Tax=Ciona savignyi TaxID=51511 RepID=H2ZFA1_CIOSA